MSLNSIKQSGGNMQGNFVVGSGLLGSGPFSGTVKASGAVQFTVRSSQVAPLWFLGSIQSDGSLSGTYCSLNPAGKCDTSYGGYGNWHVFSVTGSGSRALIVTIVCVAVFQTSAWLLPRKIASRALLGAQEAFAAK